MTSPDLVYCLACAGPSVKPSLTSGKVPARVGRGCCAYRDRGVQSDGLAGWPLVLVRPETGRSPSSMNLRVLTTEDPPDAVPVPTHVQCDESYGCLCDSCRLERVTRMRGMRRAAQPWEPKQPKRVA